MSLKLKGTFGPITGAVKAGDKSTPASYIDLAPHQAKLGIHIDATSATGVDGQPVADWSDVAGVYTPTSTYFTETQYIEFAKNGLPAVSRTTGSGSMFTYDGAAAPHNGDYSVYIVTKPSLGFDYYAFVAKSDYGINGPTQYQFSTLGTDFYGYCGGDSGRGGAVYSTGIALTNTWMIMEYHVSYTTSTIGQWIQNGGAQGSGGQAGKTQNSVGGMGIGQHPGEYGEVLIYNNLLTTQEKLDARTYLNDKWSIY